jgi:DNA helicase IV
MEGEEMSNVVDISGVLADAGHRNKLRRLLGMVEKRNEEIKADPVGAVREIEERAARDISRLRKAIEDAYLTLRPHIRMPEDGISPPKPTGAEEVILNRKAAAILSEVLFC